MMKGFKTEGDMKKWMDKSKHPIKILPSKAQALKNKKGK